jgi:hypothetical protein
VDGNSIKFGFNNEKVNVKINRLYNELIIQQDTDYYDFNREDSE